MLSSLFKIYVSSKNIKMNENAAKYLAKIINSRLKANLNNAYDKVRNYKIWLNPF